MATSDESSVTQSNALGVSAALALAKDALESLTLTILGEVSAVSVKQGYKAAYFTIKDDKAALPCLMWNNRYRAANVQLTVGQLVEVTGRFSLYAAKGRMNFDVFSLALAGEGNLRLKVANLAKKLDAEGLMDPRRKLTIPSYPERIGLVTSPRGAAVHDVLRTLRRRFPVACVVVAGVPVEGKNAAAGIIEGIQCVCSADIDVVLVVRGGGSFEDLMPFNDEALARAIAACPVPVVTGIGHEPDTSIADMVADLRASTPTAAAEAVSPARDALTSSLFTTASALYRGMAHSLERARNAVNLATTRAPMADPMYLFAQRAQDLDSMSERLVKVLPANIERDTLQLSNDAARLRVSLTNLCKHDAEYLHTLTLRNKRVGQTITKRFEASVQLAAARLDDLSPVQTLARGYAIARDSNGTIVRRIEQAPLGKRLDVAVSNGVIACKVEKTTAVDKAAQRKDANG